MVGTSVVEAVEEDPPLLSGAPKAGNGVSAFGNDQRMN